MPFGGLLTAGLLGAGGSIFGSLFGGQSKVSSAEAQLYQQEAQEMQQEFPQFLGQETALQNFYTPYLSSGSPFLKQIQSAASGQNASNYNTAAGTTRGQLTQSGQGFGPSGATAAAIGGLGAQQANNESSNYLQNLLNNENLKFQAASGLQATASALRPGQPATVGGTYTPSGIPGAIQSAGNSLAGLAGAQVSANNAANAAAAAPAATPTTSGIGIGF